MKNPLDINRLIKASKDLRISGAPDISKARIAAIAKAIGLIEESPKALLNEFVGVTRFGHAPESVHVVKYDCGEKMGFRIERMPNARAKKIQLGENHIYLLQAALAFGSKMFSTDGELNLSETLEKLHLQQLRLALYLDSIEAVTLDKKREVHLFVCRGCGRLQQQGPGAHCPKCQAE